MKKILVTFLLCTAALQGSDLTLQEKLEEKFYYYADEVDRMERYGYHLDSPKVYYYLKGMRSAFEEAWELSTKKD